MKITFDPPKRLANLAKHGLDFADLEDSFFATALIIPAKKQRFMAIGYLADQAISVIFGLLGTEALSLISMRPARKNERKLLK